MKQTTNNNQSGFTLVELAIVMMIIGLLIGGILKGQELMQNARVTATVSQVQAYQAATTSFDDMYDATPGDMANAQNRIPNCTAANNCYNGNGDNTVGTAGAADDTFQGTLPVANGTIASEPILYWRHLLLTNLISGVTTVNTQTFGNTNPAARVGGGFRVAHANGAVYGAGSPTGHQVILQSPPTTLPTLANGDAPLSGIRAEQIDRKADDGMPGTGYITAAGFVSVVGGTGCYTAAPAAYVGSETTSCNLLFRLMN